MAAVAAHAPRSRWRTVRKQLPNYLFILPHFLFFLVFLSGPVLFGFYISFHSWPILSPEKPFVGLENYEYMVADDIFVKAIGNTIRFAAQTVLMQATFGLLLALLVNQPFPFRLWVRIVLFAPVVISVATKGIIWQWLLNKDFGFINYVLVELLGLPRVNWLGDPLMVVPSISLATTWWVAGFSMIIYLAGLQNIPDHYYEAAKIDGANEFQMFRSITLPLLMPTTLFVVVTAFIGHMQVFGQVYLMTTGGPDYASESMVMWVYDQGFRYFRMGYAAALAFTLAAMIFVVTLIQFRFFGRRVEY
jgi:multiple sugar transport system permease protein